MIRRIVATVLLACASMVAQADIWGYVDDKGVAHFAAEKVDERYQLFFRGGRCIYPLHRQPFLYRIHSLAKERRR